MDAHDGMIRALPHQTVVVSVATSITLSHTQFHWFAFVWTAAIVSITITTITKTTTTITDTNNSRRGIGRVWGHDPSFR
jgi:hypothetical protein